MLFQMFCYFAHFFDTHGAFNLKHHHRIAEYSSFPENNYSFDKNREDLNKFAVSVKDEYQTIELASAFSNADKKLLNLYNYLNKKKFDDFTIILFGDHGTRFKKHLKTGNLLSKSHNNIGLYIKDKKYNFKSKKNNFVEIIDFLPSLLYRYSKNKFFQDLKKIDGKNTLYSNYKKKRIIVESVYPPKYQLQIKTKNLYSYSTYDFKNYQIGDQKNIKYYNNKEKFLNEKSLNKTGISEISAIKNKHLNKIALDKIN